MKRWMPAVGAVLFAVMLFTLVWTAKVGAEGERERILPTQAITKTDRGVKASKMELDGRTFYVFILSDGTGYSNSSLAVVEVRD